MIPIALIGPSWLWHPLGYCPIAPRWEHVACQSYNFWSGIEGNLPVLFSLLAGALAIRRFWKKAIRPHLECHEPACEKIGTHPVQGTPYRTCWGHHPVLSEHPHRAVPLKHIHKAHKDALSGAIKIKEGDS